MDTDFLAEPIYKGATRPPVIFGVPLAVFLLVAGGGFLAGMYLLVLVSAAWTVLVGGVVLAALAWMRSLTRRDDQRLRQSFLAVRLLAACRNRRFWRCRSYGPLILGGGRYEWQR
jgi:type IV secretion system protein VirB3